MNLASFYLCLFSEASLKCVIVGKEDNYKYLVALYTYHFRERFTFFFFLASLLLGNLRQEAQVFIHTRLLRVNTICGSQRKISNVSCFLNYSWQRCRCIFILFFHIQIFFWFNFRYVANQLCKCCFGIAEIKNRPVLFTSTILRENPLTPQTRHTFNRSRANLNGPIRNTFIVFC